MYVCVRDSSLGPDDSSSGCVKGCAEQCHLLPPGRFLLVGVVSLECTVGCTDMQVKININNLF